MKREIVLVECKIGGKSSLKEMSVGNITQDIYKFIFYKAKLWGLKYTLEDSFMRLKWMKNGDS